MSPAWRGRAAGSILCVPVIAAAHVHVVEGLHYIEGLPRWLDFLIHAGVLLGVVVAMGALAGILLSWGQVNVGLWWVALGCFLFCVQVAVVQIFAIRSAITLEMLVDYAAVGVLLRGMRIRYHEGTLGGQADT
jgi:hypothetical protein